MCGCRCHTRSGWHVDKCRNCACHDDAVAARIGNAAGPEWDDALLADLGRAYRNHPDVANLIAGVRRVLALHAPRPITPSRPDWRVCTGCTERDARVTWPCATVRSLNHPEESP